uniref:Uncharacterized protein MANES_09G179900 n=1 Tax=Rhizophora mucronata TaxID=61149 RepID=A0A2P2JPK0_RHIMU
MPLGKYYCDYCDKEFQDTAVARRRHLQSSSHLRAKSLWYNNINNNINRPSSAFPPRVCNRFVNTGFCPYGASCKYSHPPPPVAQVGGSPIISGDHLVGGSPLQGNYHNFLLINALYCNAVIV